MTEIEARLLEYLKSIDNRDKKSVLQSIALFLGYAHKKAKQKRQRQQTQENAPETTNAPAPAPAPIEVIPTPVEKKQQRTPQYVPGMDLNVFRAQINAVNGVKVAENDEDILRGKIKPDDDEVF